MKYYGPCITSKTKRLCSSAFIPCNRPGLSSSCQKSIRYPETAVVFFPVFAGALFRHAAESFRLSSLTHQSQSLFSPFLAR